MLRGIFKRQFAHFLSFILVASFFFNVQKSYAIYDGERSPINYSSSDGMCQSGSLEFNPLSTNNDVNWEFDNPVCISWIGAFGISMYITGKLVDYLLCQATNPNGVARQNAQAAGKQVPDIPALTPNVAYKLAYRAGGCASFTADVAYYAPTLPAGIAPYTLATGDAARCCAGYLAYVAVVAAAMAGLATIYAAAKGAYDNARVCGHDWNTWKQVDVNGDYDSALEKTRWRLSKYPGSRQYCVEDIFIGHERSATDGTIIYDSCGLYKGDPANKLSVQNQYFREYLYGGKEFEDNGAGACENPSSWSADDRMRKLGYSDDKQRYYMVGPGSAQNYACHRFVLEAAQDKSVQAAYECCKRRSQNAMCLENAPMAGDFGALGNIQAPYQHQFCELGSRCTILGITFETFTSQKAPNFICAKTYSVCPYNHMIGGGTEVAVYQTDASGAPTNDIKNFCQYRKHCVKVPTLPYIRVSTLEGAYISAACRNLRGDSQNLFSYNIDLLPISGRGFSAPLVQCFKESIENALLNRAGDTKCINPDESPSNGVCISGYMYKKDQPLPQSSSFFVKIQDALRAAIKMALTISIVLLGAMVLIGASPLSKKQLLMYILKIGLIMYFALGTGWQFGFVNGILGSSNYISDIMMRFDYADGPDNHKDGCQFPRFNYKDDNPTTRYTNPSYPPGREYLKIWDTLDCKLGRALGFGPQLSVPNLVKMIFAGFLTGSYGLMFLVATFMFAFFMLSVVMRAIHIFLMASVAIVLLIYVSPITITLAMFERTKGIFEGWVKQLLGMALQPVILFAYLGVYISLFDNIMIGKATFSGDGIQAEKMVVCNSESQNTSIYCIFRVADLKTFSGLEILGIGLPVLASLNQEKINTIIKAAFIMFIFSGFIDKISLLAEQLVGGAELKSSSPSAMGMAKNAYGVMKGVQERAMRGIMKHGGGAVKSYAKNVAARAYMAAFRGTKMPDGPGKGADSPGSSRDAAKGADSAASTNNRPDVPKAPTAAKDSAGDGKKDAVPVEDKKAEKFSDAAKKGGDDGSAMMF